MKVNLSTSEPKTLMFKKNKNLDHVQVNFLNIERIYIPTLSSSHNMNASLSHHCLLLHISLTMKQTGIQGI